jgi:hypothetical protein
MKSVIELNKNSAANNLILSPRTEKSNHPTGLHDFLAAFTQLYEYGLRIKKSEIETKLTNMIPECFFGSKHNKNENKNKSSKGM